MEKNNVFFIWECNHLPIHTCPLNEETFKSAVTDLLKYINETNLQCHYVGDGVGSTELAGLGLPPGALTGGGLPGLGLLFKHISLQEVKALISQLYLNDISATEVVVARLQAQVLDSII